MAPPVVEFHYQELADESADLSAKIEEVIGTPAGLPLPPLPPLNRIAAAARPHRIASPSFENARPLDLTDWASAQ